MCTNKVIVLLFSAYLVYAQQNDGGCICVPFYLCNNGTINTDGKGIIDIRIKPEECTSYMDTCCNKEDLIDDNTNLRHPVVPLKLPCGKRQPDGTGYRISGANENEAQFGEFPWMVAIFLKENESKFNYRCGGSFIHPQVILTAAHCISGTNSSQIKVRFGEWDTQTQKEIYPHEERNIESLVIHRQFKSGNLHNDVGLLFFKDPVNMTNHIRTVCLPPRDFVASGDGCFVAGWGRENFEASGKYQSILKKTEIPVVNRSSCQRAFRKTRLGQYFNLHESFMCAGGENGKDACTGDGGGPLVCPIEDNEEDFYYQVGIVSWGIGCGESEIPGAYVDVAHFRNWVDRQLKKKNLAKDSYEYT